MPNTTTATNTMTLAQLIALPVPTTQLETLGALAALKDLGLIFHLDDDASDIVNNDGRLFDDVEAAWVNAMVDNLNAAFTPSAENPKLINAGAWHAADLCNYYDSIGEHEAPDHFHNLDGVEVTK